jgi:hypothetical protein
MQRAHRSAHRLAWRVMAVLLPAILVAAFVHRIPRPEDSPARRLDAPLSETVRP